jgi:hypothetical protein
MRTTGLMASVGACLALSSAWGQGQPDEAALFGDQGASSPADGGSSADERDARLLEGAASRSRFDTDEEKSDPLKIGGSLLLTGQAFVQDKARFKDVSFSAPSVLETYLDARPGDRVRAFALGRLQYDAARSAQATSASALGAFGVGTTASTQANPSVALDQLWLRFDVARKVFLTVGRQKVRWGVARIWYPTDFLNAAPRDPLNPFDARLGANLLKVHVPVESLGWNFYGYGLLDNDGAANTLGRLGGALRAELVLGPAEVGLGGVWVAGRRPRYAVDLSTSLGPFDVYGEAAFRNGADFTLFRFPNGLDVENPVVSKVEWYRGSGYWPQVTGGLSYQFSYDEKNTALLTAEYFYNPHGYRSAAESVALLFAPQLLGVTLDSSQTNTLYRGQHYLALTGILPGLPGLSWVTLSLSNLLNLVDPSGLVRLDASFRVLTYLTVQAYGGVFYGHKFGQFSMSLDAELPAGLLGPEAVRLTVAAPRAQVGVMLRLSM